MSWLPGIWREDGVPLYCANALMGPVPHRSVSALKDVEYLVVVDTEPRPEAGMLDRTAPGVLHELVAGDQ
jgi:hypothetical protein